MTAKRQNAIRVWLWVTGFMLGVRVLPVAGDPITFESPTYTNGTDFMLTNNLLPNRSADGWFVFLPNVNEQWRVTPDPGGWQASWSDGDQIVALSHDGLAYSTVYTVAVAAEDLDGFSLVPGPAPNPWSFATEARVYFRVYLPLLLRSGR